MRLCLLLLGLLAAAPAFAAPRYLVTDLGTPLQASSSEATGINDAGQICITTGTLSGGPAQAYLYQQGIYTPLPSLGGTSSSANAINASGEIVGQSQLASGDAHAVAWQNGVATDLGVFPDGYPSGPADITSTATAINASGQIVGTSSRGGTRGFFYANGTMTYLGSLDGASTFNYGINDAGQIVGVDGVDPDPTLDEAYLYSGGAFKKIHVFKGGWGDTATAINNRGEIVGEATDAKGGGYAFFESGGKITFLDQVSDFDTVPNAVNNAGQIVGRIGEPEIDDPKHETGAFIYTQGRMYNLNRSIPPNAGWQLTEALAINDLGQIVGDGTRYGRQQAFLLTPLPTITVTTGKNATTSSNHFLVRGTADPSVNQIIYRVGSGGGYRNATGLAKWHIRARLRRGSNHITIRASGLGGQSTTEKITVVRK